MFRNNKKYRHVGASVSIIVSYIRSITIYRRIDFLSEHKKFNFIAVFRSRLEQTATVTCLSGAVVVMVTRTNVGK